MTTRPLAALAMLPGVDAQLLTPEARDSSSRWSISSTPPR